MSERLLPPESGPWAKAAAYTFDTNRRLAYAAPIMKFIGTTEFPDDWLPWLIFEFGLEDVVGYVRTFKQALLEGRIWQKRRGTPDGIRIGIGWVESEGEVAPPDGRHHWWEFQVGFPEPPTDIEQIRQLDGIIRLSKASEDELFRMFSPEYDHRPVRMDRHRYDTGGWMDGYSGKPRWEGGPIISFGTDRVVIASLEVEPFGCSIIQTVGLIDWFDGLRFDRGSYGQRPTPMWRTATEVDGSQIVSTSNGVWPDRWQEGSWSDQDSFSVFVAEASRDDGALMFGLSDDTWPLSYPRIGSWRDATSGTALPSPVETS